MSLTSLFTGVNGDSSVAASGYITFPNGLILQWMQAGASSTGTTTAWPKVFTNSVFVATATPTNQEIAVQAVPTTTGVTLTVASGTPNCSVIAIGY